MAAVALQMSLLFPSSYALRFGKAEGWRGLNQRPGADNLSVQEPAIDHAKFEKILKMSRQGKGRGLQRLAKQLGLPVESLDALHIGSQEGLRVFPECDDQRRLVGLLYRAKDGSKTCESGSHRGLTIPSGAPGATGPLYIVEGATDTAALHSVAMAAIGRPAARASGLVRLWLVRLLRPHRERDVIVVGDRDPVRDGKSPGRDGARELALYLRISLGRPVVWALPCRPYKDVREQVAAGEWHRGLRIQEAR